MRTASGWGRLYCKWGSRAPVIVISVSVVLPCLERRALRRFALQLLQNRLR